MTEFGAGSLEQWNQNGGMDGINRNGMEHGLGIVWIMAGLGKEGKIGMGMEGKIGIGVIWKMVGRP